MDGTQSGLEYVYFYFAKLYNVTDKNREKYFQEAGGTPAQVRYCTVRYWMLFQEQDFLRQPGSFWEKKLCCHVTTELFLCKPGCGKWFPLKIPANS